MASPITARATWAHSTGKWSRMAPAATQVRAEQAEPASSGIAFATAPPLVDEPDDHRRAEHQVEQHVGDVEDSGRGKRGHVAPC